MDMDWDVIAAIATVVGTVLTFISILVAISQETKTTPDWEKLSRRSSATEQSQSYRSVTPESYTPRDSPYTPFLYIAVGLIGACGGVASIMVPWLLLEASPGLKCLLAPLAVTGLVGGVILALVMDCGFKMDRIAPPWLRFPLSAISGVIGGWLGLLVIAGVFVYLSWTSEGLGGGDTKG